MNVAEASEPAPLSPVRAARFRPMLGALIACALFVPATTRVANVAHFFGFFGRPPSSSPVAEWLAAADVPADAPIVNGLRSSIPAYWKDVNDGVWLPKAVEQAFHRSTRFPSVYIEDVDAFAANFSPAVRLRGFNTPGQLAMHDGGSTFYAALHADKLPPFVLAGEGREIIAANAIHHTSASFRIYANPLAFAENLADAAKIVLSHASEDVVMKTLPAKESGSLSLRWSAPVTAETIHLITLRATACPPASVRIEATDGRIETQPVTPLGDGDAEVTQRMLQLDPPRDIRSISFVTTDGTPYAANLIASIQVHPPVPVGLNTTRFFFQAQGTKGTTEANDSLIAWRPTAQARARINAGIPRRIGLSSKIACQAKEVIIVLDDAPAGDCEASCEFVFADGSKIEANGVERRTLSPSHVYFRVMCPSDQTLERLVCSVTCKSNGVSIRQIHVKARLPEDVRR